MADRTQRVIWTALPNGRTREGRVALTALASPRLVSLVAASEPLGNWPDFLAWADKVLASDFVVDFGGVQARATRVSDPDPAVWKRLFDAAFVINHAFEDRRGTRILSYPVGRVHDFVEGVYGDLGLALDDELPTKRDILTGISELAREQEDDVTLQRTILARLDPKQDREGLKDVRGAFTLQEVYNMPLAVTDPAAGRYVNQGPDDPRTDAEWRQHRFETLPHPDEFQKQIDFHAIVSALNQYPALLRLTGLAVDLTLDPGDLPGGPMTDALSLKVDWAPQNDAVVQTLDDGLPRTITRFDDTRFEAVPRHPGAPLSNGFINIENERFRLLQMDVDGAGVKLRNAARSFLRAPFNEQDPERAGTPALRTAGLQLVEVDKHLSLDDAFERSGAMEDALNNGDPIELFGEDIVRGYHADILDMTAGKPWASLCRRDGTYDFIADGTVLKVEDEEGMIRLGAQEAADPNEALFQDLVKIGEVVFSWSGWSLTAPRPGLALSTAADDHPAAEESTAPPGLPIETAFRVHPKSLPALRFGHEYRVRVRVADLAGNARRLEPGDDTVHGEASAPAMFRRYEPVPPPVNALVNGVNGLERPDDGESMARMAIRSFNADEADNTVPTTAEIRRHVVPPRTSHVMAEQHGALDTAPGQPDPALYAMLAARDQNLDKIAVLHEDPLTSSSDLVDYSVGPETLVTPYLPDVLARVAAVRLDFDPRVAPTTRVKVPYFDGTAWPDPQPFKLRLFEDPGGSTAIGFDAATRTLDVPLAKAEMMRVRISHMLEDGDLEIMALWQMMMGRPGLKPDLAAALRDRALRGDHWMLTPWLEMELVHAVQKPLVRPGFLSLGASRGLGETVAHVNYRSPIHAKSTAKVEIRGRWIEPYDVPSEGKPLALNQSGRGFETRLDRDSFPSGEMRVSGDHAFGDTRFRRVTYRLEAPTRFPEFMPPAIRQQPDEMKVTSDPGVALVPNASPPPPPEIVEVTPTFGWQRTQVGTRVTSFRSGGGLRVWLKRPWFATGFGEMLGVVIAREGATKAQITGRLAKFVTQWGADPIWRSGTINSASPPATVFGQRLTGGPIPASRSPDFVPAEERELVPTFQRMQNLVLPDSGGALVDVVPHAVNFDPARDMYYCDIRVSPGSSYYPFIRLALARYHPISANGAHLSSVAIADYMQLAPDRLLVMTPGSQSNKRRLQLFGHAYTRSPFKEERPRSNGAPVITAEIQTKDPDLSDELAWSRRETTAIDFLVAEIATGAATRRLLTEAEDLTVARATVETALIRPDLDLFIGLQPPLIWEGEITVPRRRRGEELRVLVSEYERHMVDADWSGADPDGPDPGLRLIYAEALAL